MSLRLCAALCVVAAAASALDPKSLQPQGYVSDFAHVLDSSARSDLEQYCREVERTTGVQIALVTVQTLDGAPVEEFANNLFHQWGIGKKGTDDGLLLLLATNDHRSRLEVGRGLEGDITDGTAGALLRQMRPALRSGDYASALGTAAHTLGEKVAAAKGVTLSPAVQPRRRVQDEQPDNETPFPLFIGIVFIALFFMISRGRRGGGGGFLPGLILGNMMSRSRYGGSSGGGFGGYDSGGGFGGFGGGDSGGGGASSDW